MTFALSGSTITQSGTDTSLAGLAAIAGVVSNTSLDGVVSYYLPSSITMLAITGTLSHDPDFEILRLSVSTQMRVSGTYNYGVARNLNGKTTYSKGTGLIMTRTTTTGGGVNTTAANLQFLNGSTFNTAGGIIATRGIIFFGSDTSGTNVITINVAGKTKILNLNSANPLHVMRIFAAAAEINLDIDLDGITQSAVPFSTNGFNTISATLNNATFQCDGNGAKAPVTVNNPELANNAAAADYFYNPYSGGGVNKYIFQNPDVGNQIRTAGVGGASTARIGCLELWKQVAITVANTSGAALTGALVYTKLNGASMNPSGRYAGVDDYMTPRVYIGANGSVLNLLYGVYQGYDGTTTGAALTNDALSNLAGDDNTFWLISYADVITSDVESLRGTGTLTTSVRILTDTNVTLSEAAAVAKLASSITVSTSGAGTITFTANSTLDDLYDAMKAFKTRNVQAQLEFPSIGTQPVNASGTTLTTAMSVVVNAGVTLSEGSKFKTFSTTSTVTNNGTITVAYTDANNAGSISVTGVGVSDTAEMRRASDNSLIASRTGPGAFSVSPTNVGVSVYFVRLVGSNIVMSTITTPVTLTAGVNSEVAMFAGEEVQVAQAARIDLLPTLTDIEASSVLARKPDLQIINAGVKKASLSIPHTGNLP